MKNILIYYEGESELIYINKLKQLYNISKKHLKLETKKEQISIKLINTAFYELKLNDYDFVFIVCDREEDIDRIKVLDNCENELNKKNKTASRASKDKIRILVSNPSFEIWLLLHFKNFYCKNYINIQLKNELSKVFDNEYVKANEVWLNKLFVKINNDVEQAIINSNKNNEVNKKENMEKYYYSETYFQELVEFIKNNKNN